MIRRIIKISQLPRKLPALNRAQWIFSKITFFKSGLSVEKIDHKAKQQLIFLVFFAIISKMILSVTNIK